MRTLTLILFGAACAAAVACGRAIPQRSASPPATIAPTAVAASPVPRCPLSVAGPDGLNALEHVVREAVIEARFDDVIDLGPTEDPTGAVTRIARPPSVDVAVIAFPPGCPPALASAMLARAPGVHVARFDPATLAVTGVRFRRWDQARWDADPGGPPAPFTDADDVLPKRAGERAVDFVVPYPASNFKLLVAVAVLALVDRGAVGLDDPFTHDKETRPIRTWLADMITWSDDASTQALLRKLHALGEADRIDRIFAGLGLGTLQMRGTSAKTGRSWNPGQFHMTAWDTARLLWLLDPDAPPPSWRAPDGAPVRGGFLSAGAKRILLDLLAEQAFHDALSTTTICGNPGAVKGIPALLADRWIDDAGHARVELGARTGQVRPCNQAAEVTFAHKTGLTLNFGSDAGIVRGIPGRARRHYIITFFSNLGYRYTDADKASGPNPCRDLGICYTQRIPALAARIDAAIAEAVEAR